MLFICHSVSTFSPIKDAFSVILRLYSDEWKVNDELERIWNEALVA
jgi:hypothetical protein